MPLANIQNPPETDSSRQAFDFSHWRDHLDIVQAINAAHGTNLPAYPIYPVPEDEAAWGRLHQQFHTDMASVLGGTSQDLTGERDATWYYSNYQEHLAARTKLGI